MDTEIKALLAASYAGSCNCGLGYTQCQCCRESALVSAIHRMQSQVKKLAGDLKICTEQKLEALRNARQLEDKLGIDYRRDGFVFDTVMKHLRPEDDLDKSFEDDIRIIDGMLRKAENERDDIQQKYDDLLSRVW